MKSVFTIAALMSLSLLAAGQGTQFITGACTADADCASTCCGFTSGKCAAVIPAQERGEGCGFGTAAPNRLTGAASDAAPAAAPTAAPAAAPPAAPATAPAASAPAAQAVTPGTQFITGACTADADCASTCCAFKTGKCAAVIPAQERGEGCGFGTAAPNRLTARAFAPGRLGERMAAYWF
ncbi:hypothetical protein K504DRAFT_384437 [Pleomassaria siparia CBS 279.74]|uniref:Biotrophy-associated secreted protein 2 n=1 Tax=Pleomassaria siparia CBS 279.74 TaxID=1314801 RepID=A0A6G1K3L0_9PLEO|nr:hypothetical protein K504DRAFT_384437 [Pleomassaria siparia CBS 279.74]